MNNSTTSNWPLNLFFVLLTAAAMFLIGITFTVGKLEAKQARAASAQHR